MKALSIIALVLFVSTQSFANETAPAAAQSGAATAEAPKAEAGKTDAPKADVHADKKAKKHKKASH